jgi:hypothetical protein
MANQGALIFMKSDKGKSVFDENVEAILSEKIVEHTKKNAEAGAAAEGTPPSFIPPQKKRCCSNMSKSKCITLCVVIALMIAGIIAFFLFKPQCCGKKKSRFPGFFR